MTDLHPLTDEQRQALARIGHAIAQRAPSFDLRGLAGTGKTEVLKHAKQRFPDIPVVTFSNRAAAMLREKTGRPAMTIHRLIKTFTGLDGEGEPTFRANNYRGSAIFLDEASVVGVRLADDLRRQISTIVTFGDHGQLAPVDDAPGFSIDGDQALTTIHRQALGSPIIRQAHAVRETGQFEADGADFQIRPDWNRLEQDMAAADIILCFTKATREAANAEKRKQRGNRGAILRAGEPLMCLNSWPKLDLWRGQIWHVVHDCRIDGKGPLFITDGMKEQKIYRVSVEGVWQWPADGKFSMPFRLAYAATVHQAQGSEWPRVLIVNERPGDRRWLYTAITRASKRVVMLPG